MLRATTACTFSTSQLPKVVRTPGVLYILTWYCASRHNGVQFFISHLASWLRTRRFSEPTFRPSGAPNHWKNTVFRDFPTFSRICIFFLLTFSLLTLFTSAFQLSILSEVSLLNFLRLYTIIPLYSTSQLPKVVRTPGVLYILTWYCASHHNGVQFFISHLASWLRTRRFSEPTFRPSGAPNHWKNTVFRDFPTFSRICIFFLLIFSLLTLFTSAFQLSILSEVSLLNLLRLYTIIPL